MAVHPVTERIRAYLSERFPAARSRHLAESEPLLANGILDSLGVLDLVSFLEAEFQITVIDDDLLPENFESLQRLTAFVDGKKGVATHHSA
jgi:acyl carrier protein